jgi:hypothetical protein
MLQHTPLIIQDATTKIVDTQFGCSDIDGTNIAQKGGQYLDYGQMRLHSPRIIPDGIMKIVDTLLMLCWHSVGALLMLC